MTWNDCIKKEKCIACKKDLFDWKIHPKYTKCFARIQPGIWSGKARWFKIK